MMKIKHTNKVVKVIFSALLIVIASSAYSQIRMGTLGEVKQDEGYITIGSSRFVYSGDVVVTYNDRVVSTVELSPGLRVSYTLKGDGSLKSIKLLGPQNILRDIDQS